MQDGSLSRLIILGDSQYPPNFFNIYILILLDIFKLEFCDLSDLIKKIIIHFFHDSVD